MNKEMKQEVLSSITKAEQHFDVISVNLDRQSESKELDPRDFVRAKSLIGIAATSAHNLRNLLRSSVGIDEEEVIIEQLELIQETINNCREWGLV